MGTVVVSTYVALIQPCARFFLGFWSLLIVLNSFLLKNLLICSVKGFVFIYTKPKKRKTSVKTKVNKTPPITKTTNHLLNLAELSTDHNIIPINYKTY
jgi:hypothetical protein